METATPRQLSTTLSHQLFVLISFAFALFEIIFLVLYSNTFWFPIDLLPWGIPAAILSLLLAHWLLCLQESVRGCHFFAPIWRGNPPVVYRRWISIGGMGEGKWFGYGSRRFALKAVDEMELTFWGNLLLKNRFISGPRETIGLGKRTVDANPAFLMCKVPLGVASTALQKELLSIVHEANPDCQFNTKLANREKKNDPPGAQVVMVCVSVFFVLFFLDVGFSTFSYLEILKNYYQADKTGRSHDIASAQGHFDRAENLFYHPPVVSWVSHKLIGSDNTKAGIMQMRSDAQWSMGKKEDALKTMQDALALSPKNFRIDLKVSRLEEALGREDAALSDINNAISKKKDALVPRLYNVSLLATRKKGNSREAAKYLDQSLQEFDDDVFGEEPSWPPTVSPFLSDVWHRDDFVFVLNRLVKGRTDDTMNKPEYHP